MPKMIVSIDGVVVKELQLTKDRTTLGRRPYNDIVIDNLAVSGEHAALQMTGSEVHIEDLNSTNGTYVNGKAVKKQLLNPKNLIRHLPEVPIQPNWICTSIPITVSTTTSKAIVIVWLARRAWP